MKIKSPAFEENQMIPKIYSCDGDGVNPALEISEVPENAHSLALIVDDPDAPNGTFTHWLLWNIPPITREIPQNSFPQGSVQGMNGAGKFGYIAPCPPSGMHRYFFKLYALNRSLDVPTDV